MTDKLKPVAYATKSFLESITGLGDIVTFKNDSDDLQKCEKIGLYDQQQVDQLQAKIDALMLEYCPGEMSKEQVRNWTSRQKKVDCIICHGTKKHAMAYAVPAGVGLPPVQKVECKQCAPDDGWIEWGGGECPFQSWELLKVEIKFRGGEIAKKMLHPFAWRWNHYNNPNDIIAYRVVKP